MLKDLTLGRYYPSHSSLHKLDPRIKLLGFVIYLISVFLADGIFSVVFVFSVLVLLILLSKVPVKFMFKGFKTLMVVLAVADTIQVFSSKTGWISAIFLTLRMLEVIVASNLLSLTTKSKDIADGLEASFSWLRFFKVPVHDISTMVAIAVRFIPILTSEADRIMDAQKARGADFESGNLVKRSKALLPVLVPLFVSSFRKADDLAQAMDCRLYGAGNYTRLHPLKFESDDIFSLIVIAEFVAVFALVRFTI